jgi:hypothetical protein
MMARNRDDALARAGALVTRLTHHVRTLRARYRVMHRQLVHLQRVQYKRTAAVVSAFGLKGYDLVREKEEAIGKRLRAVAHISDWRGYYIREVWAEAYQRAWHDQQAIREQLGKDGGKVLGLDGKPLTDPNAPIELPVALLQNSFGQSRAATVLLEVVARWESGPERDYDGSAVPGVPRLLVTPEEAAAIDRDLATAKLEFPEP